MIAAHSVPPALSWLCFAVVVAIFATAWVLMQVQVRAEKARLEQDAHDNTMRALRASAVDAASRGLTVCPCGCGHVTSR